MRMEAHIADSTFTRNWYAVDACGNISDTVSQTITVIDNVAPTLTGVGRSKMVACTATPVFQAPTATDNCDPNPTLDSTTVRTDGACTYSYTETRYWWATDACGNRSDTVHQAIRVIDNIAPTISGQGPNATIQCTQTPVFSGPTASDNCDPNPTIDSFDTHGGTHCDSTFTRHWYAVDACGNISDTVSQTITVIDNTPPSIRHTGENHSIECSAAVVFGFASASDNCNVVSIDSFDTHGGTHCDSTFTRHWYAVDACGNISDTVTQTITVIDNIPPTITAPGANATIQCIQTPVFTAPTASDNCSSVSIDSFDTHGGTHCDSTFTRHWYAVDACGNISDTVSQTIVVVDTTAPVITVAATNDTLECSDTTGLIEVWLASHGGASATDNCSTVSWTNNFTGLTNNCPNGGVNKPVGVPSADTCGGFRTETMGGWGAPPNGGNPGRLLAR